MNQSAIGNPQSAIDGRAYLSLCSGIAASKVAWGPLGWRCAAVAEVDKFPSAVLAHHYGDCPNLGDITAAEFIDRVRALKNLGDARPFAIEAGTPCQSFSVAGLRQSLADDRGNLTLRFVEICDALDPEWIVWENVPGVLTTGDNAFGCLIAGLVGESDPLVSGLPGEKWACAGVVVGPRRALAWRVLDAQYFHLAQRRRRVFIVARRAGDGDGVASVLFEPESLRRHTPPRRQAGAGVAQSLAASTGGPSGEDQPTPIHNTDIGTLAHTIRGGGFDASDDGTGRGTPLVPVTFDTTQVTSAANVSNPQPGDPCHPLAAGAHPPAIAFDTRQDPDSNEDCALPVNAGHPVQGVAYQCHGSNVGPMGTLRASTDAGSGVPFVLSGRDRGDDGRGYEREPNITDLPHVDAAKPDRVVAFQERGRDGGRAVESQTDLAYAMTSPDGGGRRNELNIAAGLAVRRLTPRECERLQGFPDDYTLIDYRNKPAADGPRYKALGNSMAVTVMRWLGERIEMVQQWLEETTS